MVSLAFCDCLRVPRGLIVHVTRHAHRGSASRVKPSPLFNRKARAEKDRSLNISYLMVSLVQMMSNVFSHSCFRCCACWCLLLFFRSFFVFFFSLWVLGLRLIRFSVRPPQPQPDATIHPPLTLLHSPQAVSRARTHTPPPLRHCHAAGTRRWSSRHSLPRPASPLCLSLSRALGILALRCCCSLSTAIR